MFKMKRSLTPFAVALTASMALSVASNAAGLVSDVNLSLSRFSNLLDSSPVQMGLREAILEEELLPPAIELEQLRVVEGLWGDVHVRYQMKLNGYPIVGTQAIAHLSQDGELMSMTQQPLDPTGLPSVPLIPVETAITLAMQDANWVLTNHSVEEEPSLCYLYNPETGSLSFVYRLVIMGDEGEMPSHREYFLDATTGAVVDYFEHVRGALDRVVYIWFKPLMAYPVRAVHIPSVGRFSYDIPYDCIGYAYYYFFDRYGRDSFDGEGHYIDMISMEEYGNGSFVEANDWLHFHGTATLSPDVIYHEYVHLQTKYTSGLNPTGQSGALEEALSDIFSAVIGAHVNGVVNVETWKFNDKFHSYPNNPNVARRMDTPALVGSHPDHMSKYNSSKSTHFNSTIVSHAFYLLSQGGQQASGNSTINVHGLGIDTASDIFYNANLAYFQPGTTFAEAAAGTAQSALNLGRRATASTVSAWYAVGVIPTTWGFNNEGWKVSFTGWTFFDVANYVYSYDYGWAWWSGYSSATGAVDLWIESSNKWVYTSAEMYPWFFDHSTQTWKENHSGAFD